MEKNVISVSASAKAKLPPDTVEIRLTAKGEAKKYAEAVECADAVADAAVATFKKAGFDNVRSDSARVYAVRNDKKTVGYRASREFFVEFAFEMERMSAALEALGGVACEWNIAFKLKDRSKSDELVAGAVKTARRNAEIIAKAAGVKLGKLANAQYSSYGSEPVHMAKLRTFAAADTYAGAADDVAPEDVEISESVTCSWEIDG